MPDSLNPNCPTCKGVGWVCEAHPSKPWADTIPDGCTCSAGMPCRACYYPAPSED